MFTSTWTKCCHMCKTSGHVGPYHSWGHPSFFLFCWMKKVSCPCLGTEKGSLWWDQCYHHHYDIGLSKSDWCHVFLLKDNEIPCWFCVFFFNNFFLQYYHLWENILNNHMPENNSLWILLNSPNCFYFSSLRAMFHCVFGGNQAPQNLKPERTRYILLGYKQW